MVLSYKDGYLEIKLLKHSVNPIGKEALSWQVTYERMIHAEMMTHRWSRNFSSSRAIPYNIMVEKITAQPAMHAHLGRNQKGMQSADEVHWPEGLKSEIIHRQREMKVWTDGLIERYNPHKEVVNRYNEPWATITGIMTMGRAQLVNFWALRCTKYANPNIQRVAINMLRLYVQSSPTRLETGQWHTPYFDDYIPGGSLHSLAVQTALVWSSARSAWVSYDCPDKKAEYVDAMKRYNDCVDLKHATPLEHQLEARDDGGKLGLVPGFNSHRMMIPGESVSVLDLNQVLNEYEGKDYLI